MLFVLFTTPRLRLAPCLCSTLARACNAKRSAVQCNAPSELPASGTLVEPELGCRETWRWRPWRDYSGTQKLVDDGTVRQPRPRRRGPVREARTPRGRSGSEPTCPSDTRLVVGTHYDQVQHLCTDLRRDGKDTHCFEYEDGLTAEEGEVTQVRVCMDQFEAPNVRGRRPMVMQSFDAAETWCKARSRRVCTEQEWELACEGPEHRPLAYGWRIANALCNSGKSWRPFDVNRLTSRASTGFRQRS